jgi:GntR family transcriptional regulator
VNAGIAVGTAARAYKELEGTALTESRRRNGTVVAPATTHGSARANGPVPEAVTAAVDLLISG